MNKPWFIWLLLAASIVAGIVLYPSRPDLMPIHWGVDGQPDNYAHKAVALFLVPGILIVVHSLLTYLPKLDPKKENYGKFQSSVNVIRNVIMIGLLVLHAFTIAYGYGFTFNMNYVALPFAGIVFIVLGNYMPRFKTNYFMGVRTPWTLASEEVWRKTHYLSGRVFVAGGVLLLLGVFLPDAVKFGFFIGLIALTTIVPYLGSYMYYRKSRG
ncbi:SdpI family protein [Paenibacillus validus]|uniref:SdpI family protein n=1 Tax=Paenibacillus validus TaxID=44253 RepID=UPI003D2AF3FF